MNHPDHDHGHDFTKDYWEQHWQPGPDGGPGAMGDSPPNPYLAQQLSELAPGTALDAGCGAGAEAIWLAAAGWQVTAADISSQALARAAERAAALAPEVSGRLEWVEADLGTWTPDTRFDLVTTHYAHPSIPQLDFYDRLASWVAPGGTLLVVGHRHTHDHGHDDGPPAEASVTAGTVTAGLDPDAWEVVTADEPRRTATGPGGHEAVLDDVVVRATRRGRS